MENSKNNMEFISTKGMTPETAPEGYVLVQYLEPFFGGYTVEFGIAHYDNPNDYLDKKGNGWCLCINGKQIKVLAYCNLPKKIDTNLTGISQKEFIDKFGSSHPNYGCVGE